MLSPIFLLRVMTIYLTKNTTNTIFVSVGEHFKIHGAYTYVHMFFTHLVTKEEISVRPIINTLNERYCELEIDTSATDYYAGQMQIADDGMYEYRIVGHSVPPLQAIKPSAGQQILLTQGLAIVHGSSITTFDNETYPEGVIFNS